jgi:hypothetical protein
MGRPSPWFGPPRPQTLPNEGGAQRLEKPESRDRGSDQVFSKDAFQELRV